MKRITINLEEKEYGKIKRRATKMGLSYSAYLRMLLLKKTSNEILNSTDLDVIEKQKIEALMSLLNVDERGYFNFENIKILKKELTALIAKE